MTTAALAPSLKQQWMNAPEEFFDTLTFGELKIGDQFIFLPCPGDNHGHGGFRNTHYIFSKTIKRLMTYAGVRFALPTGAAVNSAGIMSPVTNSTRVLKIE